MRLKRIVLLFFLGVKKELDWTQNSYGFINIDEKWFVKQMDWIKVIKNFYLQSTLCFNCF